MAASDSHGGQEVPAGWYETGDGNERFWNGGAWTDDIRPTPPDPAGRHVGQEPSLTTRRRRSRWAALGVGVVTYLGLTVLSVVAGSAFGFPRGVDIALSYPWFPAVAGAVALAAGVTVGILYRRNGAHSTKTILGLLIGVSVLAVASGFLPKTSHQDAVYQGARATPNPAATASSALQTWVHGIVDAMGEWQDAAQPIRSAIASDTGTLEDAIQAYSSNSNGLQGAAERMAYLAENAPADAPKAAVDAAADVASLSRQMTSAIESLIAAGERGDAAAVRAGLDKINTLDQQRAEAGQRFVNAL